MFPYPLHRKRLWIEVLLIVLLSLCAPSSFSHDVEPDEAAHLQLKRHVAPRASKPMVKITEVFGKTLIPSHLVMTGPYESIDQFPRDVKVNLQNTLAHAQGLKLRYFSDAQCRSYLQTYFDSNFLQLFDSESRGAFRGDICRSAILLREGGFYIDLDFQLHVPITDLIDENTTMMTVFAANNDNSGPVVLNALIAVRPSSPVMDETLDKLRRWYAMGSHQGLPGPMAMAGAISGIVERYCPQKRLAVQASHLSCGSESMRFYKEEGLGSHPDCLQQGQVVCPVQRAESQFDGSRYGVFGIGEGSKEMRLIGWPRYLACSTYGCGMPTSIPQQVPQQVQYVATENSQQPRHVDVAPSAKTASPNQWSSDDQASDKARTNRVPEKKFDDDDGIIKGVRDVLDKEQHKVESSFSSLKDDYDKDHEVAWKQTVLALNKPMSVEALDNTMADFQKEPEETWEGLKQRFETEREETWEGFAKSQK
jgi:hypothetical protein